MKFGCKIGPIVSEEKSFEIVDDDGQRSLPIL